MSIFQMIVRKFTNYRHQVYLKSPDHATSPALSTKRANPLLNYAGVYQNILKEQWDALTGEEQAGWNDRAEVEAGNIRQNQQEFANTMTLALRDLCQGTLLGDAEMMLFYAFRQPDNGDLMAGMSNICSHSLVSQQ
ncbi:hypothetical protein B0H13DRAFT_1865723 [Mycena leptocephala]|nr:hypothetical protein B0H13DRAFT_1865723 [Mycena leptocephala]